MIDADSVAPIKRRRMIDALAELCVKQGLAGTTVSQIVECAGTSRNTFYDLYANRDEAFVELLRRTRQEFLATLVSAAAPPGEKLEESPRGLRPYLGSILADGVITLVRGKLLGLTASEVPDLSADLALFIEKFVPPGILAPPRVPRPGGSSPPCS